MSISAAFLNASNSSKPLVPVRIAVADFVQIETKQATIQLHLEELKKKYDSSSETMRSAENTKKTFTQLVSLLQAFGKKDDLNKDQRLEVRSCKYIIGEAQNEFVGSIESVNITTNLYFDFSSSKNLKSLPIARERIYKLTEYHQTSASKLVYKE